MKISKDLWKKIAISFVFWVPVIVFLKLAGEIVEREPLAFDSAILYTIHSYANHSLDVLFTTITNVGEPAVLLAIATAATVYFIIKKKYRSALVLGVGTGGAGAANLVLKYLFHRTRPSLWHQEIIEKGFSFPSGHSMVSAAFFASIVVLMWQTRSRIPVLILGFIATLLIGVSRLYLGVHYPSDVLAGWSVSVAWVALVTFLVTRHEKRKSVPTETVNLN